MQGFYDRGTSWQSYWTVRPFNNSFNAIRKTQLKRAKGKKKSRGGSDTHTDNHLSNRVAPLDQFEDSDREYAGTERPLVNGTPSSNQHVTRTDQIDTAGNNNSPGVMKFSPNVSVALEEDQLRNGVD